MRSRAQLYARLPLGRGMYRRLVLFLRASGPANRGERGQTSDAQLGISLDQLWYRSNGGAAVVLKTTRVGRRGGAGSEWTRARTKTSLSDSVVYRDRGSRAGKV